MKKIIIVAMVLFGMAGVASAAVEIGESEYPNAVKSGLSVVEFYSPSCPYCKKMTPVIQKFESEHPYVKVFKMNVDDKKDFVIGKSVQSWPTFLLYKDGVEIFRFKGAMEYDKFERLAGLTEKPSGDLLIDLRLEELTAEYEYLVEKSNKLNEEMQKTSIRLNQVPTAIQELQKLKGQING